MTPVGSCRRATSILVDPTEVISLGSPPKSQCLRYCAEVAMASPEPQCVSARVGWAAICGAPLLVRTKTVLGGGGDSALLGP